MVRLPHFACGGTRKKEKEQRLLKKHNYSITSTTDGFSALKLSSSSHMGGKPGANACTCFQ
jgi:hypothetical protein